MCPDEPLAGQASSDDFVEDVDEGAGPRDVEEDCRFEGGGEDVVAEFAGDGREVCWGGGGGGGGSVVVVVGGGGGGGHCE